MRAILAPVLAIAVGQAISTPMARAQDLGSRSSLGGYGGSMSDTGSALGTSGPLIPYAGNFGGFMPYRMGGGGDLTFRSRGTSAMGPSRTSFSLSPMSAGVSSMSGGLGQSFGSRARTLLPLGPQGAMGLGGMKQPMPRAGSMNVMPPSFGYPLYQPPSLLSPTSSSMGMSM
jgi:hypothetical protein